MLFGLKSSRLFVDVALWIDRAASFEWSVATVSYAYEELSCTSKAVDSEEDGRTSQGWHEAKGEQLGDLWRDAGSFRRDRQVSCCKFLTWLIISSFDMA